MSDSTKVAIRPPSPQERMTKTLTALAPKLGQVAAKHITPERMVKVALMACTKNPVLFECDPKTLALALLQSAEMGLEVGGGFGHAYLVPFKGQATLVVGYQGYLELIYRTGKVSSIRAANVFEGDLFDYEEGTSPFIKHKPNLTAERAPGTLLYSYAVAHLTSGGPAIQVVMTKDEINLIRSRSPSANSTRSPWTTDYLAMAQKSPIRRLSKMLPKSRELGMALDIDENPEPESAAEWQAVVDGALADTPEPKGEAQPAEESK